MCCVEGFFLVFSVKKKNICGGPCCKVLFIRINQIKTHQQELVMELALVRIA